MFRSLTRLLNALNTLAGSFERLSMTVDEVDGRARALLDGPPADAPGQAAEAAPFPEVNGRAGKKKLPA